MCTFAIGLDFADMYGRGVIVTGIPFAPYKDPKIRLKKNYLDENRTRENEMLSGQEWYQLSAIRAINQAIGRVIRHKDDYGAILFCDNRFQIKSYQEDISGWLQNHLKSTTCLTPFNTITERLNRFYEFAKQNVILNLRTLNFDSKINRSISFLCLVAGTETKSSRDRTL